MIVLLSILLAILLVIYAIIPTREGYLCEQHIIGYKQLCDINNCRNICDPNKYECNISTNRCEYKVPQDNGEICKIDRECRSKNCYFDASGYNTGIGVCKKKENEGNDCRKHTNCKSGMCANINEKTGVGICLG